MTAAALARVLGPEAVDHAGRILRDRHRRRRRGDDPGDPQLQPAAEASTRTSSCGTRRARSSSASSSSTGARRDSVHACLRRRRPRPRLYPVPPLLAARRRRTASRRLALGLQLRLASRRSRRGSRASDAHPPTRRSPDSPGPSISTPRCTRAYLSRHRAEAGRARASTAKIVECRCSARDGDVRALKLEDGREIAADLFIDCSGFRGAADRAGAARPATRTGSHWLPCDRALAVPYGAASARCCPTRAPRRSRPAGSGASRCSTAPATATSIARRSPRRRARARAAARESRRRAARRAAADALHDRTAQAARGTATWSAWGSPSGFLEPLESTAIHLIQVTIQRLILLFPHRRRLRGAAPRVQPRGGRRVRIHPRLHHPALLRQQPRRRTVLGRVPQHVDPGFAAHKHRIVPRDGGHLLRVRRPVPAHELAAGAVGAGRAAARHASLRRGGRAARSGGLSARTCAGCLRRRTQQLPEPRAEFIARHCAAVDLRRPEQGSMNTPSCAPEP